MTHAVTASRRAGLLAWWRRHRSARVGAVVITLLGLLPLYAWITMRGDYHDYRTAGLHSPVAVAPATAGSWHGATWKLVGYQVDPPADSGLTPGPGEPGPAPGTMVRAVVEIRAASASSARRLTGCLLALRDRQGRLWEQDIDNSWRYGPASSDCAGPYAGGVGTPGGGPSGTPKPYTVTGLFRVPAAAARNASVVVTFATAKPAYLRLDH